jgi:mRNA interferase RelE/StbE
VNVRFKTPFLRDVKRLPSAVLRKRLAEVIERVEAAQTLHDLPHVKKLRTAGNYRIRLGDYRIGVFLEGHTLYLARLLHRREFYRHFR